MTSIPEEAAHGFQQGADAYERGRPGYPPEVVEWLTRELDLRPGRTVLDVAAGTGKLTRELVASGATVIAVEPVPAMRAVLERVVPAAGALDGTAETLPIDSGAVDAITVASAFHWFDGPASAAEFHRVLRSGGRLALLWNRRRAEEPLNRAVDEVIERYRRRPPRPTRDRWREPLEASGLFKPVAAREVPFEQVLDANRFVDRFTSISYVAALPDRERASVIDRLRALAAGAGGQPLRLGYETEAYLYERV
ncbi:MAG: class I SAM-dependent methyltransferase [Solirubrobacterales bacterium]|nr:class I SAM-dependent methyltransferase [Solirubrobacterales bacterium]